MLLAAPLVVACGYRSPGFSIEPAASSARLGPLAGFTFDSRGRPVVFKEGAFATLLMDLNGDGLFETERILSRQVRAVRGVWLDGRMLYLLGNGPEGKYGLYRFEDRNRDDEMEAVEKLAELDAPGPGSHDMRRGPDGALTLLHAGKLLRWNEDRRDFTTIAMGLVNPHQHAYGRDGEAFVLDDGTRLIHAIPGADYSPPAYRFDVLPAMREAPSTGVEFYQHRVYPERYRDTFFQAEGPRGRIVARRIVRDGATYRVDETVAGEFLAGDQFVITELKVGPDGFVYFATQRPGGLYRIRYSDPARAETAIIRQPQPLSAWGNAALQHEHDLLESRWGDELEALARNSGAAPADRVQAILLLQRFGPKPNPGLLKTLSGDAEAPVRAAAASIGGSGLADRDALVRRRAAEALDAKFEPAVYPLLGDPDRFVRYAARLALERMPRDEWRTRVLEESDPRLAVEGLLALVHTGSDREEVLARLLPMLDSPDALRLFALASAGVKDAALRRRATEILLPRFPADGDERVNRELASALSWCGGTEVIQKLLDAMAKERANRPLQVHYAQCLRSINEGWTRQQREALRKSGVAAGLRTAQEIFDSQMSSSPPVGSAVRGRGIFRRQCAGCHRYGPDLGEVSKRLDKGQLLEAILWPSREVDPRYRGVVLELADGSALEGLLIREDDKRLLLKTAEEGNPISILKTRIASQRISEKSIMPEGLLDAYDGGAIAGLLAFLQQGKVE